MKKTLVALAALAATGAFAQSSVTIDGTFDAGYQIIDTKGIKVSGINGNGSSTSQLNFRGTEDLGGGLKANFRLETDFNSVSTYANTGVGSNVNTTAANSINANASKWLDGEIRVGLSSASAGDVNMGSVNYNTLDTFLTGQPFGTAIGSGFRTMTYADMQATSQVRAENAIKYTTPSFNGFVGSIYKSQKQTVAGTGAMAVGTTSGLVASANQFSTVLGGYDQQGAQEIAARYSQGPLNVAFSSLKNDWVAVQALNSSSAAAGTAVYTINTLAANYTMGAWKLFGLNQTIKADLANTKDTVGTTVSATYTMGSAVFMVQTGNLRDNIAAKKTTLIGYGVDYNLSKNTAAYFRAETVDDVAGVMNAAVTPTTIKGSATTYARTAVGLRMGF